VPYLVAPLVGWLVAGSLKFAINSLKLRGPAWRDVGYGGIPSTHTTIVSTTVVLIGLRDGWNTPALGVAVTLAFIVVLDALSLRGHIGAQARALNTLLRDDAAHRALRERIGHHWTEVLAGLVVGSVCAACLNWLAR